MNELVLKQMDSEKIIYRYYPEGNIDFGEVEYNFAQKEALVRKKSSVDISGEYANKALLKVEMFVESNNLPMNFTQAWY